jgi:hypothetical protein
MDAEAEIRRLMKLQGQKLSAAISVEQMLMRTLAGILIAREMDRAPNPEAALRQIVKSWTRALDFYAIDLPTRPDLFQDDLEIARMTVDSIATLASALRPRTPKEP